MLSSFVCAVFLGRAGICDPVKGLEVAAYELYHRNFGAIHWGVEEHVFCTVKYLAPHPHKNAY